MNILLVILLALSIIGIVFCWVLLRTAAQAASDEVRDAYRDAGYTELEIDTHFDAPRNYPDGYTECRRCKSVIPVSESEYHDAWEKLCKPCYEEIRGAA